MQYYYFCPKAQPRATFNRIINSCEITLVPNTTRRIYINIVLR